MAEEPSIRKRVDETWKEQAEREKHTAAAAPAGQQRQPAAGPAAGKPLQPEAPGHEHAAPPQQPAADNPPPASGDLGEDGMPQARFDLFVSGLAMEALIALGEMAHPVTRRQSLNLPQARYLIDLLGVLENKTKGNLSMDEAQMLKDTLYQLRMRYLSRAGAPASG